MLKGDVPMMFDHRKVKILKDIPGKLLWKGDIRRTSRIGSGTVDVTDLAGTVVRLGPNDFEMVASGDNR